MEPVIDRETLNRAKNLDEQALAEIYDRWSQPLYRYAMRLLGDPSLAEECVAETFIRFLSALHRGAGPENYLQAYLFRIAHNWITDTYRRRTPLMLPLTPEHQDKSENEPPQVVSDEMERQKVRAALSYLTPDQRQVIMLRYIEEWKTEEISRALGKPSGAIRALQHRALATLKRILNSEEDKSS